MKRFHARVEVVKALKELGLYVDTKENKMQIPICRFGLFYSLFFFLGKLIFPGIK